MISLNSALTGDGIGKVAEKLRLLVEEHDRLDQEELEEMKLENERIALLNANAKPKRNSNQKPRN